MYNRKRSCEVPVQDFERIQLMFLPNVLSNGKLFTDISFPPDKSSLTYVYSGDDRYEKMVFKRPKEICVYCVFAGVGGVYETPFPWQRWKKSAWFEAAIAVVSLNIKLMDQLIPGYRNFEQSLQNDYIGCFCFKLWRFGDWIDIVVDDHLPTLNNKLLYCQAYSTPMEFWGPLVEKAYAKCKKTYEANECGRTLDALTDLTGGVCEFYTPDINPPENLFHVLYKSCVNRSQIVCWRNDKLLTPTGFKIRQDSEKTSLSNKDEECTDGKSVRRFLHLVTAATKFPLPDGRMVEMIRLLCPYKEEPVWCGKFSDRDDISWGTVNTEFCSKYKPLVNKEQCEYWMTLEDFRCNFGGLIICSSETAFTTEGICLQRCYRTLTEEEIKTGQQSIFAEPKDRRRSSDGKHRIHSNTSYFTFQRNSDPINQHRKKRNCFMVGDPRSDTNLSRPEWRDSRPESRSHRPESRDSRPESRGPRRDSKDPRPDSRGPRRDSKDSRPDPRGPRRNSKDPRPDSRGPRRDSKDPRPDSRGPRRDSKDSRPDSRGPPRDSKDPRPDSRDPRHCIRNTRLENRDAGPDSKNPKSEPRQSICELKESNSAAIENRPETRTIRHESKDPGYETSVEKGILVRENTRTVKVDNTVLRRESCVQKLRKQSYNDVSKSFKDDQPEGEYTRRGKSSPVSCFSAKNLHCEENANELDITENKVSAISTNGEHNHSQMSISRGTRGYTTENVTSGSEIHQQRSGSPTSMCSGLSECQSTFSASDITFSMQHGLSRENSLRKHRSAPINIVRNASSGSLPNMIVNNFKASSSDNFRSHGAWRFIADYRGRWEKSESVLRNIDLKLHSRNSRILLNILHSDAVNQIVAPGYHGKSHVIISLLQDYRHGARTANSLLVPIGFSLYKTKNPSRDEKRSLAKLSVHGEATSRDDSREITCRFDLLPGSYFIVPYCLSENHSGHYLVRVLAEKDPVAGKTGCVVS